jgi:fucose 4-O-acetylase-like acetyltransferase
MQAMPRRLGTATARFRRSLDQSMKGSFSPQEGSRLGYVDALRGFAIVLVVLGHALQYTLAAPDEDALYRLIYSFHMPLFMFLSGFVHSGAKRSATAELRLKSRALLLPFVAWLPVTFIWMQFGPDAPTPSIFLARVIASPDAGGLWFLWVLFLINLLVLAGRVVLPSKPLVTPGLFWLLLNLIVLARPQSNVLGIKLLCWHFPFFVAGLLFRRHEGAKYLRTPMAIACGACFLALLQGWTRTGAGTAGSLLTAEHGAAAVLLRHGFNYLTAFLAIFGLFKLFASAATGRLDKPLRQLGRISLEIYAVHIYFIAAAVSASAAAGWPDPARVCIVFAAGLIGALLAARIIKLWAPLAVLMFGTRRPASGGVIAPKA